MNYLFLLVTAFIVDSASAVVYSNTSMKSPAVVALGRKGYCSGVVVGLKPLTILTARHCAEKGVVQYMNHDPDLVISSSFLDDVYSVDQHKLPGDISVLVFKNYQLQIPVTSLFLLEPFKLQHWQTITVCGYGASKPEVSDTVTGLNNQRCGTSSVHLDDPALNFFENGTDKNFSKRSSKKKAKILHSVVQGNLLEFGAGSRLGIAAVLQDGSYDKDHTQALVKSGDSGGPAFIQNDQGRNILVGINSMETVNAGKVEAGIIWRIDHPSIQDLLRQARSFGADL
jgi:hypothetical protein